MTLTPILPATPAASGAPPEAEPASGDGARFQKTLTEVTGRSRREGHGRPHRSAPSDGRAERAERADATSGARGSTPGSAADESPAAGRASDLGVDALLLAQSAAVAVPAAATPGAPVAPAPGVATGRSGTGVRVALRAGSLESTSLAAGSLAAGSLAAGSSPADGVAAVPAQATPVLPPALDQGGLGQAGPAAMPGATDEQVKPQVGQPAQAVQAPQPGPAVPPAPAPGVPAPTAVPTETSAVPAQLVPSQAVPSQAVPSQPASSQPASSQPASSQPASSQPASSQPAPPAPAAADGVPSTPTPTPTSGPALAAVALQGAQGEQRPDGPGPASASRRATAPTGATRAARSAAPSATSLAAGQATPLTAPSAAPPSSTVRRSDEPDTTASSVPPATPGMATGGAPNGASATSAASSTTATADASPGQPVAVPDQVLRHLESVRALREGGHRTVMRLDPEHLGAVTVTVDVREGAVRMAVAGGAEALAAVREGLGHLRSALADAGLDLGDVALRPDAVAAASSSSSSSSLSSGPGTSPEAQGGQGTANRPDAGADGSTGGEQRPARQQEQGAPQGTGRPDAARPLRGSATGTGDGDTLTSRRLDVRV
jgi:hypothetical protein